MRSRCYAYRLALPCLACLALGAKDRHDLEIGSGCFSDREFGLIKRKNSMRKEYLKEVVFCETVGLINL